MCCSLRFQNCLLSSGLYVDKHKTIILKSIELLWLLMLDHPAEYTWMCLLDWAEVLSVVQPANLKMVELQIFGRCWQAELEDILSTELSPLYKYLLRGIFLVGWSESMLMCSTQWQGLSFRKRWLTSVSYSRYLHIVCPRGSHAIL